MKCPLFSIFIALFLCLQNLVKAEEFRPFENGEIICIQKLQGEYLDFFHWSAMEVVDKLAQGLLSENEWKAVRDNPQLWAHVKAAADFAQNFSESLCPDSTKQGSNYGQYKPYGYGDEVDAVRHFSMSAYISFYAGEDAARNFMTAHENEEYALDNIMDYYNNEIGARFGTFAKNKLAQMQSEATSPGARRKLSKDKAKNFKKLLKEYVNEVFEHGEGGNDFAVRESGSSTCAKEKYPNLRP